MKITKKQLKKQEKRLLKKNNKLLWLKLRNEVYNFQNEKCYLCQNNVSLNKMDIHHIIDRRFKPLEFDKLNLVGLCKRCHRLSIFAVHQSSIYFSDILRTKDNDRYYYLLNKFTIK